MLFFLTGASGYIGGALARRLRAEGHDVRALVRAASRTEALAASGVRLFTGDVTDRASMREGMSGVDWVVHAAADLDLTGPAGRMKAVNVEGTENTASLAFKLGVPRFLWVSSVAYFGGSPADGSRGTESSPPLEPFPTRYSATKHAAERRVRAWEQSGLHVDTVYPSLVYGPPGKKEGANAILRSVILGRFPFLMGGDQLTSWIFLDDLVEAIVRILGRPGSGGAYLLAGDVATTRDVVARVAALAGVRAPKREVSIPVARFLLRLATPVYRLRGRRLPVPVAQLASLERHWAFDDSHARRSLGWTPRTLAEGLPPTLEYLRRTPA